MTTAPEQSNHASGALLALSPEDATVLEAVVVGGDLAKLRPEQRVAFYRMRCDAAQLDYRTQPFSYIVLQGKLTLYATKTATEQLCEKRDISTAITDRQAGGDIYVVTCRASLPSGRFTDATGAVTIGALKGDALCNAYMKAETKSKRRAVLALCGLGMLDETESETVKGAETFALETLHTPTEPERIPDITALSNKALREWIDYAKSFENHPQKADLRTEFEKRKEAHEKAKAPVEGEVVQMEHVDRWAALNAQAQAGQGYLSFIAACVGAKLRWAGDDDIAAFETATTTEGEMPTVAEQVSDVEWENLAGFVADGSIAWQVAT